jgi:hypothetical protein
MRAFLRERPVCQLFSAAVVRLSVCQFQHGDAVFGQRPGAAHHPLAVEFADHATRSGIGQLQS